MFLADWIASDESWTESVLIYVINPFSYNFCAVIMVRFAENRNFVPAACWRVLVIKGGGG